MEKIVELTPLAEIGRGRAVISDNCVKIEVSGISGGMKAWLIGREAVPIGNIVNGYLCKNIDTRAHSGVLITQSGRQMLIGRYGEETVPEVDAEDAPFKIAGFDWKKVTGRRFDSLCEELRFIISNKSIYNSYKKYGHYWVGEGREASALAVACGENEQNPLEFLGRTGFYKNGYAIVCVDKETKKLYIPPEI